MIRRAAIAAIGLWWLVSTAALARAEVTAALLVNGGPRTEIVRSAVAGELGRAGWRIPGLTASAAEALRGCLRVEPAWSCLEPRLLERGLTRVVAIQLAAEAGSKNGAGAPADWKLIGQLGSVDSRRISALSRYCERCDDAQLAEAARLLVQKLVAAGAVRDDATRIEVRTTPPGAVLRLDGRLVEAPGGVIACSPGLHTVHVQRAGYRAELRAVLVEEGKMVKLEVPLLPESASAAKSGGPAATIERVELGGAGALSGGRTSPLPAQRTDATAETPTTARATARSGSARPSARSGSAHGTTGTGSRSTLAWALGLGGGALLATGATLLWLDEDAVNDASVEHSPRYFDSAPAGVALLSAGGMAMLAGAYLFLAPVTRSSPAPTSGPPMVPASAGGARAYLLSITGAF